MNRKIVYFLFLLFSGILIFINPACKRTTGTFSEVLPTDSITTPKAVHLKYGISYDSLNIIEGKIRRNQFLSDLLSEYRVPNPDINQVVQLSREVFDVRKIKRGNPYVVFQTKDSLNRTRYVVYEHTPTDYIVFDLGDSINVYKETKQIIAEQKTASGIISVSLWNTINEESLNLVLVNDLSEIFAWSIDFFGLQKGDSFKIVYEEQYVDSTSIGISKIYAAWFNHMGEDFFAIPFVQNNSESYFDINGNSLRKAFLKAPLRFSRISSRFSNSRLHPILKIRRPHHGVDYAAPVGTPVHAIGDGKIIKTGYFGGAGRMVKIRHNSVYTTAYMHLSRYGKGVKSGKYVKQGDIIGYVGSSGLSTGPHLDFRFYKYGTPIDPLKVKAPPVEPVSEENREDYEKVKSVITDLLNTVH
ncbi:MAG: peptidoglycan DD-metalloendopeptidase family protein [Bacteroidales bacterium]|nr:peptidoglycan DD-metalloendopeptidase family protein [Bacteroidales bacterium]